MPHKRNHMWAVTVSEVVWYLLITVSTLPAATYYVATDGDDRRTSTQAQSIQTPWQTLTHAAGQVRDGDTVRVRGGVYCEEVVMQSGGVTWQAYPGETPIIDGSVELNNPIPLQDANDFLDPGGISIGERFAGNPNWRHIYKVRFPVSDTSLPGDYMYKTMILDNNELLGIASLPAQPNNVYDDDSTFIQVNSACVGAQSMIITSGRTEPDDYWNGAAMDVYLSQNNTVVTRHVEDWNQATQTFTLSEGLPYTVTSQYRYKLENHWGCLTRPGEFYVSRTPVGGYYTAYVWPVNHDPNVMNLRVAKYDTGWEIPIGQDDNITIDGFTVRNFCGLNTDTSFGIGRRLSTSGSVAENITIKNCTVRNIEGRIAVTLGNAKQSIVENCTVENIRTGWGIYARGYGSARCEDVVIRNCSVDWCRGTNYKFSETDYGQIQNCLIGRSGTHGNGIAIYENCTNIGIFHCLAVNSDIGIAYQACTNLYVIGNDIQTSTFNMAHWEATTAGDMIFLNNTMTPGPEVSDLLYTNGFFLWSVDDPATPARYVVKNNIFWSTSWTIPSDYTTPPNTFDNGYNCFLQTSKHWPAGPGSFENRFPKTLFTGWANETVRDLTVKNSEAGIYRSGVNVNDIIQSVEQVFAARGPAYAYDLGVDRRGIPWADPPSIGAYEYVEDGMVYNAGKQRLYQTIQQAIQDADYCNEIIVSPGVYRERIDLLGKTVRLRSLDPHNRAVVEATIIDAGQAGRAVTFNNAEDANSLLAGFTITGGFLDGENEHGAGISCNTGSPRIENCLILNNYTAGYGGGVYLANASVDIRNSVFANNEAFRRGGGLMNDANTVTFISDCIFVGNTAGLTGGALVNDMNSLSKLVNCSFTGNVSGIDGGGVYNDANSLTILTNCTFSGNWALRYGGGLVNIHTDPNISNCILWGNSASARPEVYNDVHARPAVRSSNIAGSGGSSQWNIQIGIDEGNNIDADPLFIDPANDDVRLLAGSPCIDAGDIFLLPLSMLTDAAGRLRFVGRKTPIPDSNDLHPLVDMGAYEYACEGNVDSSPEVTLSDFAVLAHQMEADKCGFCHGADLTGDGYVTMDDLHVLMAHWLCGIESKPP